MRKIFIAGEIPEIAYEALKEYELDVYKGEELISEEELQKRTKDADAILSLLSTPVKKETIDNAENLKIVANFGAGFDNIDYEYAGEKEIPVSNTPLVSTEATAELTMGYCWLLQEESQKETNYAVQQDSADGHRYFFWEEKYQEKL